MKKIISFFCALALVSTAALAQKNDKAEKKDDNQWREKIRAEQVAFITSELNLSEAEAQAFWPVYNEVQEQRREAFKDANDALRALKEGTENNSKEVGKLLDQYVKAKQKSEQFDMDVLARYKKVLSVEQVAKLVVAEEKFRHQQIGRLGAMAGAAKGDHPGQPGGRRGGPRPVRN